MDKEKVVEMILNALYTDGAHHKQYDLHQIFEEITKETVEEYFTRTDPDQIEIYGLPDEGIPY